MFMPAYLQILESKDPNVKAMKLVATGKIGWTYDDEEGFLKNDLVMMFDILSYDLKCHLIDQFPEIERYFPDENMETFDRFFGQRQPDPGIKFMLDELLKNAMDASVMNTENNTQNKEFSIDIKIKIKKQMTTEGNKYSVKISDNGTGFKNLKPGQKKEFSGLFPEKSFIQQFFSCLFYMLFFCWICFRSPLINSTKNKDYLLGHNGWGLESVNQLSQEYNGGLFFKNRKKSGAKVEVVFMKEKLPTYRPMK